MMALTRGSNGLFPCPICLVPKREIPNLSVQYPLRNTNTMQAICIRKRGISFSLLFLLLPPFAPIRMQKEQKNQKTGGAACHCLGHFWSLLVTFPSLFLPYKLFSKGSKRQQKMLWLTLITFSDFTSFGFLISLL